MKILGKNGMELANVALEAKKGEPLVAHAVVPMANMKVDAAVTLERVGDDLVAHVKIPKLAPLSVIITLDDISGAKAAMNGDVFKFALKAMMH